MRHASRSTSDLTAPGATPGHLLALIRSRSAWTRQQLMDATGMSRPTLLDRLAPLFAAGLAHTRGVEASIGGRPAQLIRFDDRHLVTLTFDVGHTRTRVSVSGVHGEELRAAQLTLHVSTTRPAEAMDTLVGTATKLLAEGPAERLIGIGMAMPAPVSPENGQLRATTTMPGWEAYPLLEQVRQCWNLPVILENDARALALGEATRHPGTTLLGVKWSHGIGAGLVNEGKVLPGDDGAAGDIGHVKISSGGPQCRCGHHGCLAAHASGYALKNQLASTGITTLDELVRRADDGDPVVRKALVSAGRKLGTVLATLIAFTNPRTLLLGGALARVPQAVKAVEARIREITLHRSIDSLQVITSQLQERAGTVGLVRLVVEHTLSPEAVDSALRDGRLIAG